MSRVIFLLPLSLFVFVAIYFMIGLRHDPSAIPSMLIDKPAPEFSLPPIEGREIGLATEDFAGEIVLLNVFGSWCVSCKIEHPVLMEIKSEGFVPLLGLDWKDKPGAGAEWLARLGDPYARIGDDADGRVAIDFGVTGAPETFLIDANGRVRYKQVGPITIEIWRDKLKPMIEELKNETPPANGGDDAGASADCADAAGDCR